MISDELHEVMQENARLRLELQQAEKELQRLRAAISQMELHSELQGDGFVRSWLTSGEVLLHAGIKGETMQDKVIYRLAAAAERARGRA